MNNNNIGVLIGLTAGDRIGGPSQMALYLANSLYENKGFNLSDIGSKYLQWWEEDGYDSGPTAARIFSLVCKGESYSHAARVIHEETGGHTAGCNPVHRNLPLAMCGSISEDQS